jgi:hypothetical protein
VRRALYVVVPRSAPTRAGGTFACETMGYVRVQRGCGRDMLTPYITVIHSADAAEGTARTLDTSASYGKD